MLSVAMLSRWHVHAEDYAREAMNNPNIQVKMVWDENADRGQKWATELGVEFEPDLEKLFASPEIDAVTVTTATSEHYEVIMAAIQAGKHVFTEKVLAFTQKQCIDILQAAKEAGVKVMVSLPRLTHPYYLETQAALDAGLLGSLTSIRCRVAHDGALATENKPNGWLPQHFYDPARCGGGALIDLGAHPIYLTNRLAGQPTSVMARLGSYTARGVDDNSAVIVEYQSGVLGIIEVGFVASSSPFMLEVHGTEGSAVVEDTSVRLRSKKLPDSRWYNCGTENLEEFGVTSNPLPMPMEQWVAWILEGREPSIRPFDIIGLTAVNEAAAESDTKGCRVPVQMF